MKATIRDQGLLKSLSPEDLATYLAAAGWHREESGYQRAQLWVRTALEGQELEIVAPTDSTVGDYARRISELLLTLEQVERRSQLEIATDLQFVSADVVRFRRPTDHPAGDSIVLHDGAALVSHAMTMVTAAACSAVMPRAVIPSRRPLQAQDYLRHVRMGQTERGSYVVTVISKVEPLNTPGAPGLLEYMEDPFPRKVTRTLARALNEVDIAASEVERTGDFSAFTDRVPLGISANLCDALRQMVSHEETEQEIGITVAWAPSSPVDDPYLSAFKFQPWQAPILGDAARYLRASEPQEGTLITGVVVNLHRDEREIDGLVTVSTVLDGGPRQLRVPLSRPEYLQAAEAHLEKKAVMFRADLVHTGRRYVANNIQEFRVID